MKKLLPSAMLLSMIACGTQQPVESDLNASRRTVPSDSREAVLGNGYFSAIGQHASDRCIAHNRENGEANITSSNLDPFAGKMKIQVINGKEDLEKLIQLPFGKEIIGLAAREQGLDYSDSLATSRHVDFVNSVKFNKYSDYILMYKYWYTSKESVAEETLTTTATEALELSADAVVGEGATTDYTFFNTCGDSYVRDVHNGYAAFYVIEMPKSLSDDKKQWTQSMVADVKDFVSSGSLSTDALGKKASVKAYHKNIISQRAQSVVVHQLHLGASDKLPELKFASNFKYTAAAGDVAEKYEGTPDVAKYVGEIMTQGAVAVTDLAGETSKPTTIKVEFKSFVNKIRSTESLSVEAAESLLAKDSVFEANVKTLKSKLADIGQRSNNLKYAIQNWTHFQNWSTETGLVIEPNDETGAPGKDHNGVGQDVVSHIDSLDIRRVELLDYAYRCLVSPEFGPADACAEEPKNAAPNFTSMWMFETK